MKNTGVLSLFLAAALYAQCPFNYAPEDACPADTPVCALFSDGSGDDFCDNPGPRLDEPDDDSFCPLGFTPLEACPEESPSCALYSDARGDSVCDNPGLPEDETPSDTVPSTSTATTFLGCPLRLPPEAACPSADNSLCPHYRGLDGCSNPAGGGVSRTLIILIATAVLLPVSTVLRNYYCGLGRKMRHKRKIAHIVVHSVSLLVLGFLVFGCFCPIGLMQYALLPDGLTFIGIVGFAALILPMIWSLFFCRIYCGWVCPFGALQDLLGKLHVPRPPRFPKNVHAVMSGFRYLIVLLFFGFIIFASSGIVSSLRPQAFFCSIDPFRTIFSFFMVGSFLIAVLSMAFLVFFPRFFCKYLCFYGAILSFFGRVGLMSRLRRKNQSASCNDDETDGLSFPP